MLAITPDYGHGVTLMYRRILILALLTSSLPQLVACSRPAAESPGQTEATTAPPAQSAVETPGAQHNPAVVRFEGFGPAKFGDGQEAVRMSWGAPLTSGKSAPGSSCYIVGQDPPPPDGRGISFMFENERFVRYDVDVARIVAPGNLVVGATADDVRRAHAGRVEEQPHKYVEGGRTLIVTPAEGGDARLVVETDSTGTISRWHIGVQPQVLYVEGCS